MMVRFVIVICLCIIAACSDSKKEMALQRADSIETATTKRQQELEHRMVALEQENQKLKQAEEEKRQREAEERAKEQRRYSLEDVVGVWDVTMRCTESDCSNVNKDALVAETWTISSPGGGIISARVVGNTNTNPEYTGTFDGKWLVMTFQKSGGWSASASRVKARLKMTEPGKMAGQRIVTNDNPCTITYSLTASKH